MSKKKVVLWTLLCSICILCTLGHFGLQASATYAQIVDCDILPEYQHGDKFAMPDGKVSYQEQEKEPDSKYVVFPSGKASKSDTVVLSETGKYELVFQASFDGVTVSARKSFVVPKSLLQVNNESSRAGIEDGKIAVSLAPDDVFTYNAVIDLSAVSRDVPLLDMEFTPNTIGQADATRVKIRLTDIYDEENYVTISLNHFTDTWASGHIYMTAGAAHQPQVGVENPSNPDKMKVYTNDVYGYGSAVSVSLSGMPSSPANAHLTMYYDYEQKAFYADRESYSGTNQIITDLDAPEFYGDETWTGFTTGQVKMTVYATNYQSATCNFLISTISGNSEFVDVGDVYEPIISVDTDYEPENIPTALVGRPYPTFEATAVDGYDGNVPVVTAVYYRYYSEKPVKIAVEDGQFTPSKEGVYVIEYTAEDQSGNLATACVSVNAVKGDGMQVELLDTAAETDTGALVKVFSGISYSEPSGNVSYCVTAKNLSTGEEVEIDPQTLEFTPMSDGDWEITVTARDYISTVAKTFTVKANHTAQPQVFDTVGVPEYFILGAAYQMPKLSGYDFSSGKGVLTDMDVFVTETDSEEKKLENGSYVPEKAGSLTVTYRLSVDGKVCEKSYAATVVDVGYTGEMDLSKYFVASAGSVSAQADTGFITYETSEDTKLDFLNFVQVKQLTFSFRVGDKNAYQKVHVYLSDIESGKQVKLSYNRTDAGATFSINDGAQTNLSSSFDGMNRNFLLEFHNDTHMVSPEAGIEQEVKKFLDGSDFTGFTGTVARFAVEIEGVSGASQFVVNNLNGQTVNNATMDRFAPQLLVDTNSGDRGLGEKITLRGAFAYDVLNPTTSLSLDITDPSGAYVTDENGVCLDGTQDATKDCTFAVDQYGDYVIQYIITDGTGKTDYYVYAITVKDVIGPTITLLKHAETAKTGDTVKLAGTEVKDNITAECPVYAYVYDPEGVSVNVTDGKFEATVPGVYTVGYLAFDENGNSAFAFYKIDVRGDK